ncbi:hypothetical protein D3C85_1228200 [compost metagenome]
MARVVRKLEMARILDLLFAREITPACVDLLPGGAVRIYLTAPAVANDDANDREAAAWDEALS